MAGVLALPVDQLPPHRLTTRRAGRDRGKERLAVRVDQARLHAGVGAILGLLLGVADVGVVKGHSRR
jgi:hypothetical protein